MAQKTVIGQSGIPTAAQLGEFWRQVDERIIGRQNLQNFLEENSKATLERLYIKIKDLFKKTAPGGYAVDSTIIKSFSSDVVNSESSDYEGETSEYVLSVNKKYENVVSYLKEKREYLELTLLEGLKEVIDRMHNGYFDKLKRYLIIPLSTRNMRDDICYLYVFRRSNGELSIIVKVVRPKSVWNTGYSFLICGKNS